MPTEAERNAALRARSAGEINDAQLAEVLEGEGREEPGLWATISNFLFGDDDDRSPREREMVMSPEPSPPNIRREDYDSSLDYSLAKTKAENEYRRLLEDRRMNPGNYMVPAASAAEPNEDTSRYERGRAIDEAVSGEGG